MRISLAFAFVILAPVAASLGAGCSGRTPMENCGLPAEELSLSSVDEASFTEPLCGPDAKTLIPRFGDPLVSGLGMGLDFVELRQVGSNTGVLETEGSACAGARDTRTCTERLREAAVTDGGWPTTANSTCDGQRLFLLATRGDEVFVVDDQESLSAFLGTVDSLPKARLALLLRIKGVSPCSDARARKLPGGGYEVVTTSTPACNGRATRRVYRIGADASVTLVGKIEFGPPASRCPG